MVINKNVLIFTVPSFIPLSVIITPSIFHLEEKKISYVIISGTTL